jgi:flagellar hook-basal body complex protein FliE
MDDLKIIRNNQEFVKLPEYKAYGNVKPFSKTLDEFMTDVNSTQLLSGEKTKGIITGQLENLHDASIAGQKAKVTFELMLEIRKKVLESYQELMRMPV